jgi:hypothetical protein
MSILDDAIREHLALKRAHGANDVEVKKLEDEAFGPPQRPDEVDPFAEAPTEFLTAPAEAAAAEPAIADEGARSGRRPNIADLQEGPPAEFASRGGETEAAPPTAAESDPAPGVEEQPAAELALPPQDAGPNTQERQAIADQPTEMFDVQAELSGDTSATPATTPPSPSDEELVDASQEEPRLTPVEPESGEMTIKGPDAELAGQPPAEAAPADITDEHDEYFSEQRLSDELDRALESPLTDEEELPDFSAAAPPPTTEDFAPPATDEDAAPGTDEHARPLTDDFAASGTDEHARPVTDEHAAPATDEGAVPYTDEHAVPATDERDATLAPEPPPLPPTENDAPAVPTTEEGTAIFDIESEDDDYADGRSAGAEPRTPAPEGFKPAPEPLTPAPEPRTPPPAPAAPESPAAAEPRPDFDPDTGHEDVLEDTPDFLENAPEDDDLWFEQRPPKDFDFDD